MPRFVASCAPTARALGCPVADARAHLGHHPNCDAALVGELMRHVLSFGWASCTVDVQIVYVTRNEGLPLEARHRASQRCRLAAVQTLMPSVCACASPIVKVEQPTRSRIHPSRACLGNLPMHRTCVECLGAQLVNALTSLPAWIHHGVIGLREKPWRADALGPAPRIAVAISRLRLATV